MVRSVCIAALVVGLAWPGLAGAQLASPTTAAPRERYITVREEGKLPQRCKLLKTWHEPNGLPAFQVQCVETGELLTIVGSGPPSAEGGPRAMSTRIFHWGNQNKPPTGSPLPPPTASTLTAPPPLSVLPRPTPALLTARKPDVLPAPVAPRPAPAQPFVAPPVVSTTRPPVPNLTPLPNPVVRANPVAVAPPARPTMLPAPLGQANGGASTPQPRLVPSTSAAVVTQAPCDCCCPPPCNDCCKPCDSCCQSSCVCCTPSPLRQSFLSRLFKPHSACSEVVCQPTSIPTPTPIPTPMPTPMPTPTTVQAAPKPAVRAVAKVMSEPAKPRDFRESWGKVEPWKAPTPANSETLTKRVAPTPVTIELPKQPDPLKAPEVYRNLAMDARPQNSKIPNEGQPSAASSRKPRLFEALRPPQPKPPLPPPETRMATTPPSAPPPSGQSSGRGIQLSANEPNAFWTPAEPPAPRERPKDNAFDRAPGDPPPQGGRPALAGAPMGPMPPRGPMPMVPMGPPRPPMPPPMANTGVPEGMGNAFTLAGTRRPIPADFGGTPQEPNGFGDAVPQMEGQGSPPRAYNNGMSGAPRPPMPNQMAMAAGMPMGVNPLMSVPYRSAMPSMPVAATPANGVPHLLVTLKDSLYPSEREWAAEQLSELNWHIQPQIVENLMKSAREDPAATVRVACVHALSHMKVNTSAATTLVQNLKDDRDPRVRQEAEEALSTLGVAAVPRDSAIQPVSHR